MSLDEAICFRDEQEGDAYCPETSSIAYLDVDGCLKFLEV